jgi:cyclopropane fatty-acyl-phospholipid synthase-like methyltransferase
LDYLSRAVNQKTDLPPLHLRRYVGPLRTFEASGAEFMAYLQLLARLLPEERILDVGCGCGLMAIYLREYLDKNGGYVGVDIHKPSIRWCQKRISTEHDNIRFMHIDVRNHTYNPRGVYRAEDYRFSNEAHSFNVVLLKSVFTHMRPAEIRNYMREVARLLKCDGRCLMTCFLLNEEQKRLAEEGRNKLDFRFGGGEWFYVYEHSPESAVAYEESYVLDLIKKCDLRLKEPIYYGRWTGKRTGLSFQDILVLERN